MIATANWRNILLLFIPDTIWGTSFLLTEIILKAIPPFTLTAGRTLLATPFVLVRYARGGRLPGPGSIWFSFAFLGLFNGILPYVLISWGQLYIDSNLATILIAVNPFCTLVLAHFFTMDERLTGSKILGISLGLLGVILLMGPQALQGLGNNLWGQLAVIGSAFSYVVSTIYMRHLYLLNNLGYARASLLTDCGSPQPPGAGGSVRRPATAPPQKFEQGRPATAPPQKIEQGRLATAPLRKIEQERPATAPPQKIEQGRPATAPPQKFEQGRLATAPLRKIEQERPATAPPQKIEQIPPPLKKSRPTICEKSYPANNERSAYLRPDFYRSRQPVSGTPLDPPAQPGLFARLRDCFKSSGQLDWSSLSMRFWLKFTRKRQILTSVATLFRLDQSFQTAS